MNYLGIFIKSQLLGMINSKRKQRFIEKGTNDEGEMHLMT